MQDGCCVKDGGGFAVGQTAPVKRHSVPAAPDDVAQVAGLFGSMHTLTVSPPFVGDAMHPFEQIVPV